MATRRGPGLRVATARGGVVNAVFLSGAEALVLLQGLLATALLGPDAIGLYGVVTTTAMTIVALRRVGIDEAFVQERASDEREEFERAFTVELGLGLVGALLIAALAPLLAAVYDDDRLLALTLAVAYLPVAFALQAPQWVFFKRMDYVRLRVLQAIVPLGTVAVAVPLLLAGVGVWALVIGPFCGNAAAVLAAWRVSPYPLRLRPERRAARRYLRFSWPVFVTALAALLVAQGQIAVFGISDGLAAAGYITLAATLTRYVDRADQILATTIYPAIVRVRDRAGVLEELFGKANRLTLMWAFPFGAGLALFGGDLVRFVLGDEWDGAIVLLGGLAVAGALQQVGYNWFAFYRARGESWPQAVESGVLAGSFALFAVPGALLGGAWWFVAGRLACTACVLAVRHVYVRRLLPGARMFAVALRAAVPVALASAPVLIARLALWGRDRSLAQALIELAAWLVVLGAATRRLEGDLLAELRGYLRPSRPGAAGGEIAAGVLGAGLAAGGGGGAGAAGELAPGAATAGEARRGGRGVTAAATAPPAAREAEAPRARRSSVLPVLLWLAGAVISGFTLRRHIGPLDEGILMQAATRMGDGQWPWRDFSWAYGPGEPLAVMAAVKAFGPSLLWWRLLRVAADATAAVLVWALVRDERPRWALAAWAAAALIAAQPVSANPAAPALAFALAAVLLASRRHPAWAGAAAAAAGFWRPDMGAAATLAAMATAALAAREAGHPGARRPALVALASAAAAGAVLYGPFAIAAGPGELWDALVVQATRDGAWWRLPFPDGFPGGDALDFLRWLAPYAALAALIAVVARARRAPPCLAGLLILALGATAYFLSRADEEHAQTLLVLVTAIAAIGEPRWLLGAVLALILLTGAGNRASALLRAPDLATLHVHGAGGVRVSEADANDIPRLAARVRQLTPGPIYVAPRRSDLVTFSDPLLHYLVGRPNVLHRDVLLQAKPSEQAKIVAALRRAKPVVIRWTDPASAKPEPNRRGRPSGSRALDDYLRGAYREDSRFGVYVVLVPR